MKSLTLHAFHERKIFSLSSFSLTWGGGHYDDPIRLLLVLSASPEAELDGCDVILIQPFLILLPHASQDLLLGDVSRDVVYDHPGGSPLRCAGF